MRRLLLATSVLVALSAPAVAQSQCGAVPAAAAAAGYTTQTFGGPIAIGQNWQLASPTGTGTTQNADGSVTIGGATNNSDNSQMSTSASFGGGEYIQATIQTSGTVTAQGGWPSLWAVDPSQGSVGHRMELDIAEIYGSAYGSAMHDWNGAAPNATSINTNVPQVSADFSQPHTFGALIEPGSVQFYFDNNPVGSPVIWSPGGPFSLTDNTQFSLILGNSGQVPATFSNVQVWQNPATANDTGVSVSGGGAAAACAISPTVSGAAVASSPPSNQAPTQETAPSAAEIVPGQGSITDPGGTWTISGSGCIQENGQDVPGGCQSAAVEVVNGVVWGKDDGKGPVCPGCWFQLSGATGWVPEPGQSPPDNTATTPPPAVANKPLSYTDACINAVPNYAASTGGFGTVNGQIYSPNGTPFIAKGVNLADWNMGAAQGTLLNEFPGLNFVRLNISSYQDPSAYQAFINWATSNGIVVEIDDHTDFPSNAFAGAQLAAETQFFSAMASAYKTNPYVWFETQNEPQGGDITAEQVAVYNAVRNAGNNNPVGIQLYGGGDPGFLSQMNLSAYTSMTNVFIAPHFYDWLAGGSSDPSTVSAALQSEISQAQQIQTADGTPPVIIDEYGNATDGVNIDSGGSAVVAAVNTSGYGSAAWSWQNPGGGTADQLTNSGTSLTSYGSQVAGYMAQSGAQACAQSPVPTEVTAPQLQTSTAQTAPTLVPAATEQTAPQLQPSPLTVDQVAAMAAAGD